jgi:hypothetical protein
MLIENFLGGQQGPKALQTLRQAHVHLHLESHTYLLYVCYYAYWKCQGGEWEGRSAGSEVGGFYEHVECYGPGKFREDSHPAVVIRLDVCLDPTIRAEPHPSASFLSSAMKRFGGAATTLDFLQTP